MYSDPIDARKLKPQKTQYCALRHPLITDREICLPGGSRILSLELFQSAKYFRPMNDLVTEVLVWCQTIKRPTWKRIAPGSTKSILTATIFVATYPVASVTSSPASAAWVKIWKVLHSAHSRTFLLYKSVYGPLASRWRHHTSTFS